MTDPEFLALCEAVRTNPADEIAVGALADWIEEHGGEPHRIRRLAPQDGDVLAVWAPEDASGRVLDGLRQSLRDFVRKLEGHGKSVLFLLLESGMAVQNLPHDLMGEHGWVRVEAVREAVLVEREACARLADEYSEDKGYDALACHVADMIRERKGS